MSSWREFRILAGHLSGGQVSPTKSTLPHCPRDSLLPRLSQGFDGSAPLSERSDPAQHTRHQHNQQSGTSFANVQHWSQVRIVQRKIETGHFRVAHTGDRVHQPAHCALHILATNANRHNRRRDALEVEGPDQSRLGQAVQRDVRVLQRVAAGMREPQHLPDSRTPPPHLPVTTGRRPAPWTPAFATPLGMRLLATDADKILRLRTKTA